MKQPTITVVTLGPGDPSLLTLQTADYLRSATHLILRTDHHPCAAWLQEQSVSYRTLDDYYDRYDDFDQMHQAMAEELWAMANQHALTYAVIDAGNDLSLKALRENCPENGRIKILPGVSISSACQQQVMGGGACQTLPAISIAQAQFSPSAGLLITEMDDVSLAGEVKLKLMNLYRDDQEVFFFPPSVKASRTCKTILLEDLDRQKRYDHTVCAWIPAVDRNHRDRFTLCDLAEIMEILRAPGGCPWDREQDHVSLKPYLIEEAWEAIGAIDNDDPDHLYDELGDVLLQIVFHSSIGLSRGEFDLTDVTSSICAKMMRRHSHIFGQDVCHTAAEVTDVWEKQKAMERGTDRVSDAMAAISEALPSLMYAQKIQKKAARVGFDWQNAAEALEKVTEEAREAAQAMQSQPEHLAEELGDLLFSCVNVIRLCGMDSELLMRAAAKKFFRRFESMENLIISEEKCLKHLTLKEMDVYWNRVKLREDKLPEL